MIEIERPNITAVESDNDPKRGTFVLEPLERGKNHRSACAR